MYAINSPDFSDLIQWASEISEVMAQRNRSDIVDLINQFIDQLQKDVFTISVIGKAKRGKSTLINALMGRNDDTLAPIDKLPASSAITRFQWGEEEKAEVFFQDNHRESITWSDIRNYVTEENNPANRKGVSTVIASGPIRGLENHIELVDTPGAGSIHKYHDALLHAFIPLSDAVIFIVTARMPLDVDELELLRDVKKADISKIFFVINRVDEIDDPEDLQNAISHNQALLEQNGVPVNQFYKLSAKQAFLEQSGSGIESLIDAVQEFLKKERALIMRKRFISRVCGVIVPELQSLEITIDSLNKTSEQIDADIQTLDKQKIKIETQRKKAKDKFSLDWSNAVSELQREVSQAECKVKDRINKEIDRYSILSVSSLHKKLPTILVHAAESELKDVASNFEKRAQEICKELQVSYPYIEWGEFSRPNLRDRGNAGAWATTAIGTGAAVGGGALASAGASAAATIAAANATAATATIVAGISSSIPTMLGGVCGILTGNIAFGTAAIATSITSIATTIAGTSTATVATPLWVALSGPVGWTIAGLGLLAIPFAWSISKSRQIEELQEAAEKEIQKIFTMIKEERIPQIQEMENTILDSFQNNLDNSISQSEEALKNAKMNRPSEDEINKMKTQNEKLITLMKQAQTL